MKYRWLLFDLDNTLYDFDAAAHYSLETAFKEQGIDTGEEIKQVYYEINHKCWEAFEKGEIDFKTLRNARFERFIKEINAKADALQMSDRYLQLLSEADFKIEGAIPLLDYLKPKYNLAVVTNGLKEVKRPQLSKPEIAHYFKAVIISEELGIAKPHHGFFEHTFNMIGNPEKSEAIIIGDSLSSDIRGGNDYGIHTCWFNPNQKENKSEIQPTFEIKKLSDLIDIIE